MNDAELIKHLGGPAKVAKILKFTGAGARPRVQNWMTRGIPAHIKVSHPHIFLRKPKVRVANPESASGTQ